MNELIDKLNDEKLGYISVDCKKVWMSTYLSKKRLLDKHIVEVKFSPEDGGYVKTDFGFEIVFFLTRRDFFDNYNVDWVYGDTNHGQSSVYMKESIIFIRSFTMIIQISILHEINYTHTIMTHHS